MRKWDTAIQKFNFIFLFFTSISPYASYVPLLNKRENCNWRNRNCRIRNLWLLAFLFLLNGRMLQNRNKIVSMVYSILRLQKSKKKNKKIIIIFHAIWIGCIEIVLKHFMVFMVNEAIWIRTIVTTTKKKSIPENMQWIRIRIRLNHATTFRFVFYNNTKMLKNIVQCKKLHWK